MTPYYLVNENAVGPNINPMKELYWKQFGGEPDAKMLAKRNPQRKSAETATNDSDEPKK